MWFNHLKRKVSAMAKNDFFNVFYRTMSLCCHETGKTTEKHQKEKGKLITLKFLPCTGHLSSNGLFSQREFEMQFLPERVLDLINRQLGIKCSKPGSSQQLSLRPECPV